MATETPTKIKVHPIEHGHHDSECTEGLTDEECNEVCTAQAKRMGICKCKRSENV